MRADSVQHLQASLTRIDPLIRAAVARAQAAGHDPTDALRGLIVSDDEVQAHLDQTAMSGLWRDGDSAAPDLLPPAPSDALPLLHLAATFQLTPLDLYILLLVLAPDLDRRYERLYAYLQDDVTQRRPTVNLVMNLLGGDVAQRFAVLERLTAGAPLRAHLLVDAFPDPQRYQSTFIAYQLKVDPRVVYFLLGLPGADERLKYAVRVDAGEEQAQARVRIPGTEPVRALLPAAPMVYLKGSPGTGRRETAVALCAEIGIPLVSVDMEQIAALEVMNWWRMALREAALNDAALLIDGWERCLDEGGQPPRDLWTALRAYPRPVFLSGLEEWEPRDVTRARRMLRLNFPTPAYDERRATWLHTLGDVNGALDEEALEALANKYRFTREQIAHVAQTAADLAASRGEQINGDDLVTAAQSHSSIRLGHLARRITPRARWHDLILPPDRVEQLREICARARYSHIVEDEWGFGKKVANALGVSALFAGESGTGKTLAAEVIAHELGLPVYKVDLSAVVSKYIGETEKNLAVIFKEAQSSNAILFFDEADAIFGKRSEVKDAHDRYANLEVAYLLQQVESYDGVALLATNLRQNLDEAFTRRLDFMVDFPFPDEEYRHRIWMAHFPPEAPLAADVDLGAVAVQYRLAGGNIRNAALAAAYMAAADSGVITLGHIRHAVRREHQKMGRLLDN